MQSISCFETKITSLEKQHLRACDTVLIPYLQADENLHIGHALPD